MAGDILVLQQLDIEPPALIGDILTKHGHHLDIRHTQRDTLPESLETYCAMVVMGGPMSANDTHEACIRQQLLLLQQAISIDFPVLGICLGAQLLAKAAGASIIPSPQRELGWYPLSRTADAANDVVFADMPEGQYVFQWHGESFTLPKGACLLASNTDVPHQAFRLGNNQYGLQYHTEVDATLIQKWIDAGKSERQHLGDTGIARLIAENPLYLESARQWCRTMTNAWSKLLA